MNRECADPGVTGLSAHRTDQRITALFLRHFLLLVAASGKPFTDDFNPFVSLLGNMGGPVDRLCYCDVPGDPVSLCDIPVTEFPYNFSDAFS